MKKDFYISQVDRYLPIIKECFASDKELLSTYHVCAPSDLETCVRKTFNDLKNASTLKFFVIECVTDDTDEVVGFFGVETISEGKFLTSFCIKPKYRTKDTFSFFWESVYRETGNDFFTAIHQKNERAKKFLEKNGFELVLDFQMQDNTNGLLYKNN